MVAGEPPHRAGITVDGIGAVEASPDIAILEIGVATESPAIPEAREQAAMAADALIASLKSSGVEGRDLRTAQFSITPIYDYSTPGNGRLVGYSVANTVMAVVRDIGRVGDVMDAAVAAGGDATRVNGVRFEVDDGAALLRQARERAMDDARSRAEQLASLAGVSLGAPASIVEGSHPAGPGPMALHAARDAAFAATPIAPGTTTVEVRVTVRWAIAGD